MVLDDLWKWHKEKKKTKNQEQQKINYHEMKKYWFTQHELGLITKSEYDLEIDRLDLDLEEKQLNAGRKTPGEIAGDFLVSSVSATVKGIFSMSGVGKNRKK